MSSVISTGGETVCSPVVPGGGKVLEPASDTALRSGSGRFRLGRFGSGGKPAGRGIRPTNTNTHHARSSVKLTVSETTTTCATSMQQGTGDYN